MARFTIITIALMWAMHAGGCCCINARAPRDHAAACPPSGFTALFDGRTLDGWRGWTGDPSRPVTLDEGQMAILQAAADRRMRQHWTIRKGELRFDGRGDSLCTVEQFGDFELMIDWKILATGDSGIYLRGCPQVQIWNQPAGSGGLYNNNRYPSVPLRRADRPPGQWNTFLIRLVGDRVTVYLNGMLVVDDVELENMWDRLAPIPRRGHIELQAHGTPLWFRNIWIRRLEMPGDAPHD